MDPRLGNLVGRGNGLLARKRTWITALLAIDDDGSAASTSRAIAGSSRVDRLFVVRSGDRVINYLQGDPPYGDRQRYPFPGLLILDHVLPGLSGLDVLLWLRSSRHLDRLPVVMLSLGLTPGQIETARRLNAACCMIPVLLKDLPNAIEQATNLANTQRSEGFAPGSAQPIPARQEEAPEPLARNLNALSGLRV